MLLQFPTTIANRSLAHHSWEVRERKEVAERERKTLRGIWPFTQTGQCCHCARCLHAGIG